MKKQDISNVYCCIESSCNIQPKLCEVDAEIILHQKKKCQFLQITDLIKILRDKNKDPFKVYGHDWLSSSYAKIEQWETEIINEFNEHVKQEANLIKQQVCYQVKKIQEQMKLYNAITVQDIDFMKQHTDMIPVIINPQENQKQVRTKLFELWNHLDHLRKSLHENLSWADHQDQIKEFTKDQVVPTNKIPIKDQLDGETKYKLKIKSYDEFIRLDQRQFQNISEMKINKRQCKFNEENMYKIGQTTNLNKLVLSFNDNHIQNLSPLQQLTQLTHLTNLELFFSMNQISDISALKFIGKLKKIDTLLLYFSSNKIMNISTLEELKNIRQLKILELDFEFNKINDFSPLEVLYELPVIQYICLDFDQLPDQQKKVFQEHFEQRKCHLQFTK